MSAILTGEHEAALKEKRIDKDGVSYGLILYIFAESSYIVRFLKYF